VTEIPIADKGMQITTSPQDSFILPYLKAAASDSEEDSVTPVLLSSTEIYIPAYGRELDETSSVDTTSPWYELEQKFIHANTGHPHVIVRAAPIVGTGMRGFVRSLAEDIWRGTFFHFPDNGSRLSVVHAVDVASVLARLSSMHYASATTTVYNITDGVNPTLHDLAESLAFRMDNKRISTLSTRPQQWLGRMLYGKKKYAAYTTERLFNSTKLREATGIQGTDVCLYLRTHIYDECSL